MRLAWVLILYVLISSEVYSDYVHKCVCKNEEEVEGTCEKLEVDTCLVESGNNFAVHSFKLSRNGNKVTARTYLRADKQCKDLIVEGVFECDKCGGTTIYKCPKPDFSLAIGIFILVLFIALLTYCLMLLCGCILVLISIVISSGGFIASGISILTLLIGRGLKGRVEEVGSADQPSGVEVELEEYSDM